MQNVICEAGRTPCESRLHERNVSLDVLRVLCMFLIVLGHAMFHGHVLQALTPNSVNDCMTSVLRAFLSVHVNCFVLLSGWLLGPWWGAAAGGIGSMLADLLLGYGHYAPGTLIIKGVMALVAALIFKAFRKNGAGALVSGVVAEIIMVAGYFGYAGLLLGKGIGAAASIPGNLVQGAVGLVAGFLLLQVARRTHLEEKLCV